MVKGILQMSDEDIKKNSICEAIKNNKYSFQEAESSLSLSVRQIQRIYKRYLESGTKGILHKGRGKISNNIKDPLFKQKVINTYKEQYLGFANCWPLPPLRLP